MGESSNSGRVAVGWTARSNCMEQRRPVLLLIADAAIRRR